MTELPAQEIRTLAVEHFKDPDEAQMFIESMTEDGYACSKIETPLGFFVSVLELEDEDDLEDEDYE